MWTTADEIVFVKELGTGVFCDRRIRFNAPSLEDRLVVLQKYRTTLNRRRYWNGMSRTEIELATDAQIKYVQTLIRNKE